MKKAFTLAETLIVLVVIGILAAILLPVAKNIAPDRNLMKFKKAHNTLGSAIRELVQSEEYYLNGDLGVKVDGTLVEDKKYFCETLAQVVNYKKVSCSASGAHGNYGGLDLRLGYHGYGITYEEGALRADQACKECQDVGEEILISDNIVFYQAVPSFTFGYIYEVNQKRYFGADQNAAHTGENGFGAMYKIFCLDIDGLNKGEDPFGYGIRADGKIFTGKRATEWLEKAETN